MKVRLYLDEDAMDSDLVSALRLRSIDVTTVRDERRQGQTDEQQLHFATVQGRAIYTFNTKDFTALHSRFLQQGLSHAGIIVAPKARYSVGEQMRRLVHLVDTLSAEEMKDRLEFLSAWGID
ncbi:MAG TPA: DUF5615 family PIN-like protein [Chloroflexia bacterium]|nr:DUF5615 family PIN-like protein [Chloroflexia bacterium]